MKVIFLDVDGVLNAAEDKDQAIDRHAVGILKRVIDETGAEVVLSSGWRFWFDDDMEPREGQAQCLCGILNEYGITLLDKTPDFSTEEIRETRTFSHVKAQEIRAWLKAHPQTEEYVVLDDLDLRDDEVNAHRICVNGRVSLTDADARCAVEMLNGR